MLEYKEIKKEDKTIHRVNSGSECGYHVVVTYHKTGDTIAVGNDYGPINHAFYLRERNKIIDVQTSEEF